MYDIILCTKRICYIMDEFAFDNSVRILILSKKLMFHTQNYTIFGRKGEATPADAAL